MAPLASWNNITLGHRCGLNINHTPQEGIPNVAVVSPDKIFRETGYRHMMKCQPQLDLDMP